MADLTIDQSALLTAGATMWTTVAIPEAGIPSVRMADGPMGVAGPRVDERDISVLTPAPVSLGASWDVALVERVGRAVGTDAIRRDIQLMLAPNLNLARSPLAGRAFEYYSEDPLLAGVLGAAWITGLQSRGVGAVAKHLVCNDSETARDTMNAVVDERTLREVYLLPFEFAARAGCAGMLTAYNKLNGSWCSESKHVISQICKGDWAFTGVFMSDWFGTHSTLGCVTGGLDLEMPGPARFLGAACAALVDAGEATSERVADAAARVAAAARRFAEPLPSDGTEERVEALLLEAAAAGFTLVRNEGDLLPLDLSRHRRIAVIGPNATAPCYQGGTFAKIAVKQDAILPLQAVRSRLGETCEILYEPGVDPQPRLPRMPTRPARDLGDGYATGMTIDYFDARDAAVAIRSETRDTNSLTWFYGVHEEGAYQAAALTRASGVFLPQVSGEHLFYLGGTGAVRLTIDGAEVLRRDDPVPASDVMGRLKSGDADVVPVRLEAGRAVEVVAELRYNPARVQGLWYGIRPPGTGEEMIARAVAAAEDADAVLLFVGETSDSSVESKDRADTALAADQVALIERVCSANPNTAVIVNVGHAVDTSWEASAAAVLLAWYPGQEFGPAIAAVVAGDREPGGRLPMSIAARDADYPAFSLVPDDDGNLPYRDKTRVGYRGMAADGLVPRHAFGSGFGFTRFTLSDAVMTNGSDGLVVEVTVRNVGLRPGAEVVQVYRPVPELTLVAFTKVHLAAGEERRVSITIPSRRLMMWENGWMPLVNLDRLMVGRASDDLPFILPLPDAVGSAYVPVQDTLNAPL